MMHYIPHRRRWRVGPRQPAVQLWLHVSSWNDLALGPKIAKLASRHLERDESRHVIARRHFLHGRLGPTYEAADNTVGAGVGGD
jgi:hypothetical protein